MQDWRRAAVATGAVGGWQGKETTSVRMLREDSTEGISQIVRSGQRVWQKVGVLNHRWIGSDGGRGDFLARRGRMNNRLVFRIPMRAGAARVTRHCCTVYDCKGVASERGGSRVRVQVDVLL